MASEGPLAGVCVQDLTGRPAGAFCARLLASFGADEGEGDVVLAGTEIEVEPGTILCVVEPWAGSGAAQDITVLARSGVLDLSGELDGPPVQPAVQIAELGGGGLPAAVAILAALRERDRTGVGRTIHVSLLEGTLALIDTAGPAVERGRHPLRGGRVSYMPYPCRDGWVALGAQEPEHWAAFCRGLGREDLLGHADAPSDGWAQGQVEHELRRRTRAEWEAFGIEHDCCLEPVRTVTEAVRLSSAA